MKNGFNLWREVLSKFPTGSVVAGGAVRDFLLGVEPKDIDVFYDVGADWEPGSSGFCRIDARDDRTQEYDSMAEVCAVSRGLVSGFTVDAVGVYLGDDGFNPRKLVSTFDFGISQCWAYNERIYKTHAADKDLLYKTWTLLRDDRLERALSLG